MKNYQINDVVLCKIISDASGSRISHAANYSFLKKNRVEEFKIIGMSSSKKEYVLLIPDKCKYESWVIGLGEKATYNISSEYLTKKGWLVKPRALGGLALGFRREKHSCKTCDKLILKEQRKSISL